MNLRTCVSVKNYNPLVYLLGTFQCLKIEVSVCHKTKIFVRFVVLTVGLSSLMWHHTIR